MLIEPTSSDGDRADLNSGDGKKKDTLGMNWPGTASARKEHEPEQRADSSGQ